MFSILLFQCLAAQQQQRIPIHEVKTIHLYKDRYTTRHKNPNVPQMICNRGCDNVNSATEAVCTLLNYKTLEWICTVSVPADMEVEKGFKVICEGFEGPGDRYWTVGGCQLRYNLTLANTNQAEKKVNGHSDESQSHATINNGDFFRLCLVAFGVIVLYMTWNTQGWVLLAPPFREGPKRKIYRLQDRLPARAEVHELPVLPVLPVVSPGPPMPRYSRRNATAHYYVQEADQGQGLGQEPETQGVVPGSTYSSSHLFQERGHGEMASELSVSELSVSDLSQRHEAREFAKRKGDHGEQNIQHGEPEAAKHLSQEYGEGQTVGSSHLTQQHGEGEMQPGEQPVLSQRLGKGEMLPDDQRHVGKETTSPKDSTQGSTHSSQEIGGGHVI